MTARVVGHLKATMIDERGAGAAWAGVMGERIAQEQYDWEEWRATRSYVALDLDSKQGMERAKRIRAAMVRTPDSIAGPKRADGMVVAVLAASSFTASEEAAALVKNAIVVMKVPGRRLPVVSVHAPYDDDGGVHSRSWGQCTSQEVWVVIWAANDGGEISEVVRQTARVRTAAADGGGRGDLARGGRGAPGAAHGQRGGRWCGLRGRRSHRTSRSS